MDIYHIWCDLKPKVSDVEFADSVARYMDRLQEQGVLVSYRIMRRKLGLGPSNLPEFHVMLEFEGLAQLDQAFTGVSERTDPLEEFHHAVNSKVQNAQFALYRDFPDAHRQTGEERF